MSGPHELPEDASSNPRATRAGERLSAQDDAGPETLAVLEETLQISKRQFVSGTVRVSTRTDTYDEVAEVELNHDVIDVTSVPVGQVVDIAPSVRTEGDTTIVPVVEERFVVVKQLYLKEELHIRRQVKREVSEVTVPLRRQRAVVERFGAGEEAAVEPSPTSADPASK